jgi:hypothetical protein
MKRVISLCLLTIVSVTSVIPAFAQASKRSSETKTKSSNAQTRFGSLRAYSDGAGVLIQWEMAAEKNNIGFTVSRTDGDGTRLVSKSLIPGSAAISGSAITSGEKYSFFDAEGDAQASYSVTSIQANGKSINSTSILPEYISDLRSIGSASSQELSRQVADKKSNGSIISNRLELPKTIVNDIETNQLADDPVNHRFVISQPGVKIGVKKEGFYRVTRAELQSAGFNANGDSSLWQLYLAGVQQSIIVGPNNGDYIEFYGTGVDTPLADTRIYYLISGPAAGKRIESRIARPTAGTVTSPSYSQTFLQSERINYFSQVLNGSLQNYWGQPINSSFDTTVNFTLTNVDFASPNATLDVSFEGFSFDAHFVEVKINGQTLATANGNGRGPFSKLYTIPTSFLNEGANSLLFRMQNATSSFFDTVKVGFARKFGATQNRLSFFTQNYRRASIEGFSSANIRVFDMTAEGSPALMTNLNVVQNGGTFGITMPAGRGRLLYAVENSGLMQAASLTQNDPTILATPNGVGDLIIISYKGWMTQAENWANYRRGQGFTVKVIEVSEIYDEFNYGVVNSLSIRNFLQYAASNWQVAPRYVLLLGDASYDARNYEGFGNNNFVPTHMVDTVYIETGSDDTLADFDNDGLAEMAVGRIPSRTAQGITNALAKVTAYELAARTMVAGGVLFASDQYDAANNYNFQEINNRLRSHLPPAVPVMSVVRSDTPPPPDTPQTLLISSMNSGKYLVNYAGHGSLGAWANSSFFSSNNVPALTNASNQSIFTMLTCLNGYFLHANFKSLAENLLDSTNGGAVAAWASTGETTPDVQEIMATRFFIRISGGSIERLGDLINDAKTTIPGGVDVRLSWALIGDPMLKVRTASTGDRQQ